MLRISPARISKPQPLRGFTLIELVLFISLLAVLVLLATPALQGLLRDSVAREVDRLRGVVRLIRNESVLTRRPHRIIWFPEEARYIVEYQDGRARWLEARDPRTLRPHSLPKSFLITRLFILEQRIEEKRGIVFVDHSGFVDPFTLWFTQGGEEYTLKSENLLGELRLYDGHLRP